MDTSREAGLKVGGNGFGRHFRAARLHWPVLAIACLVPLAGYNYLLFHTLVELASIIVACGVFVIAWNAFPFSRNRFLLFLGTGLLWVSGLDLFHTLVYRGMNLVPGIEGGNVPTQFWIGTRYLHAAILLAAPLFIAWPLKRWWAMSGLGAATGAMFLWLLSGAFPDAYLEGSGLTPFKIYSEYAIVAAFGGAIAFLWHRRKALDERIYLFVMASTVLLMAGELAFTKYVSVYGPANLVGHLFKVLAYWLIYVALVDRALAQPFRIMARAASTYDAIPDATVVVDREGVIHQVNEAARQVTGLPGMEALGRDCHALFHVESAPREACAACVAIREGRSAGPLELEDAAAGRWIEVSLAPVARGEEVSGLVHVSRDITSRKNATELVRREQAHLTAVLETLPVGVWITDPTGRLVQGNPAGREVWGGAHYVGMDRFDEYKGWWSDSGKRIAAEDWAVARAIRSGESAFGELIDIEGFDGKRRTILNSAVPLRGAKGEIEGVVVVNQDVTERREAERERERLFRDLVERMKELACMYAISDVLERRGDDLGDVLHEIAALLPPAFHFPDLAVARVAVGELEGTSTGFRRTPWRTSEDVVASGECVGIVEVCYREEPPGTGTGPFLEEEHKLVDVVAERMGRLVERLEAKKRVESLSRLYATLGQTNQAIIHVTEPQPLFHEICRLACETGGFATAWIGMEGPGGEGFAVAASRGLDEAEIVLLGQAAANPDGNVSRVLRTGRTLYTNDCGVDPQAGCWLPGAASQGIGACAIIALRVGGKVSGVLGLHVARAGGFGAAQLALVEEMAADISFALDSMERERRRRLDERALAQSEAMLKEAQRIAGMGNWRWDITTNALEWTDEIYRIFGLMPGQFDATYDAFVAAIHPEDREAVKAAVGAAIRGDAQYEIGHRIVRPDGGIRHVHERGEVSRDAQGHPVAMIGTVLDVTERQQNLLALRKLNRALTTLGRCNEELVHATDETALLDSMCRIIVEVGGYRLAWVGYAQDDPGRSVLPVACAGADEGYVAAAAVSWADDVRGRGPVGTAIRLGAAQVVQDAMRDPGFAPWRDAAVRLGIASVLALPLLRGGRDGRAGGALAIYAMEAGAFDDQEIALLEELASDLSYGIAALRTRTDRNRAREQLARSLEGAIASIARALEMRDPYTAGHQRRVAELSVALGREMGLAEHALVGLRLAAGIHDIGKISVPAEVLSRPGRLTSVQFELIKAHSQVGHDIVEGIDFPWPVAEMILQHHERLDGSGYPAGLRGDEIISEARILAVADVVEAMASHRPYRPALGMEAALAEITARRGVLFDERVVDACVALVREGRFEWSGEEPLPRTIVATGPSPSDRAPR